LQLLELRRERSKSFWAPSRGSKNRSDEIFEIDRPSLVAHTCNTFTMDLLTFSSAAVQASVQDELDEVELQPRSLTREFIQMLFEDLLNDDEGYFSAV